MEFKKWVNKKFWKKNQLILTLYCLQIFDKDVKGSIYQLEGTPTITKISIPKDSKHGRKTDDERKIIF